jgi:type IX secretion system PorP/SprF family membrane protein
MKKIITLYTLCFSLCLFSFIRLQAQDEAIFNHYIFNPSIINPAFAGFEDKIQLFGHLRNQWAGFANAPTTYDVFLNAPITNKVGLGAMILTEKFGVMSRFRAQLAYAYRYVGNGYKWSAGFSTEFHNIKLDQSLLDGNTNQFLDRNDPLLTDRTQGTTYFDATFGVCAAVDKWTFSLSIPNLIQARLGKLDGSPSTTGKNFGKEFLAYASYKFTTDNTFTVEPSLLLRKVLTVPFEAEANVKLGFFDDKLVTGITIRPGSSGQIGLIVGTKQPNFQIYYSYASSLSNINSYTRAAHEITIALDFKKPEKLTASDKKKKRKS